MNLPKISVIIPNYNYAAYIAATIDSVLAQSYKNVEIIVVDDGSKDNSLEVLAGYGDKISVIQQKNSGVATARNMGVKNSDGEYIAFLDADDIWLPDKLERQMNKFIENEQFGLVHCSMKLIDPTDKTIGETRDGLEGWVANEFLKLRSGVVVGSGSTGLIKRKIFEEISGFDPRMSTAADWDFCYRLAVKYPLGFVEEPLVLYRIHNSNMHGNIKVMEHDMLLGFKKAFLNSSSTIQKQQRECYSNLHMTLAGSYFNAKQYSSFAIHALKSLYFKPTNLLYFMRFPFRYIQRNKIKKSW